MKPLCIDLFCGLGGWADGFLSEGWEVIGYDIERHVYGTDFYPGVLILQDVLDLHGSMFRNAECIVASPPCQKYSYMAMPWSRGKKMAEEIRHSSEKREELNRLFNACFRIQREASAAAGRHIPMVVENVRGAIPWVGRSAWNYGSFHLWGDVPALMPFARAGKANPDGTNHPPGSWFAIADSKERGSGTKVPSFRFDGSGGSFQTASVTGLKNARNRWSDGAGNLSATTSSHSSARKAASAQIAKIPFPLAQWMARVYKPEIARRAAA